MDQSSRRDLISQGIAFLQHPEAQQSTLSNKISFLEKSGLTGTEISEVMRRMGSSAPAEKFDMVSWLLNTALPAAAVVTTGVIAYYLTGEDSPEPIKEEAIENAEGPSQNGEEGVEFRDGEGNYENGEFGRGAFNPEKVLNEVADALERQTETLEKAVDKATYQLSSEEQPKWAQELLNITSSLAAELAAVRQLLEKQSGKESDTEGKNSQAQSAATDTATAADVTVIVPLTAAQHMDRVRVALKALALTPPDSTADSSTSLGPSSSPASEDAFKQGCGALLLYIGKVADNPTVPRYRKIATSNASFKSLVMPMKGHEKVLQSVGFKKQGAYYEWMWVSGDVNSSTTSLSTATKGATTADASEEDTVEPCADDEIRSAVLSECVSLLRIGKESGSAALVKEIAEREAKEREGKEENTLVENQSTVGDVSTAPSTLGGADIAAVAVTGSADSSVATTTTATTAEEADDMKVTSDNAEITTAAITAVTVDAAAADMTSESPPAAAAPLKTSIIVTAPTPNSNSNPTSLISSTSSSSTGHPPNISDEPMTSASESTATAAANAAAVSDATITATATTTAATSAAAATAINENSTVSTPSNMPAAATASTASTSSRSKKAAANNNNNKGTGSVVPFDQIFKMASAAAAKPAPSSTATVTSTSTTESISTSASLSAPIVPSTSTSSSPDDDSVPSTASK